MYLSDIVAALQKRGLCDTPFKIYAECDKDGNCELANQVEALKKSETAGFLQVLRMAAERGPRNIPASCRHEIGKQESLYEFIKGNYRIAWFYDGGNIVVCSHLFRKKTRKTPPKEIAQVLRLRESYMEAKEAGKLEVVVLKDGKRD